MLRKSKAIFPLRKHEITRVAKKQETKDRPLRLSENPGFLSQKNSVYATFPGRNTGYRTVFPAALRPDALSKQLVEPPRLSCASLYFKIDILAGIDQFCPVFMNSFPHEVAVFLMYMAMDHEAGAGCAQQGVEAGKASVRQIFHVPPSSDRKSLV